MNIKEGIEKRFSVRAFTDEVPKLETIKEILKTANAAPSGGNIQPWKVYVLTGKKLKEFTSAAKKEFITNSENLALERLNYMKKYREPYTSRRRKVGWDLYQILNIKNTTVNIFIKS